jgi:aspartyl-tRNA(Asn)/glutamyl-tRNA(Gln) amidotransferase subunit A
VRQAARTALDGGLQALADAFHLNQVTPLAVLDEVEARIASTNGVLNAIVHRDSHGARMAAEESTNLWKRGEARSGLDGAPIAVKANIAVAEAPWTAAIAAYRDRVAAEDAYVVGKLRAAGAVIVGLANMHEAALGAVNDGPLYGKAYSPLRKGFTPGGSSGGSAAAVAAGYVAAALGTDTLGSSRVPAAYCGVVGFKPTYGTVSQRGVSALSWTLDHVGVLARSAADAASVFLEIDGYDERDPYSEARDPNPWMPWGLSPDDVTLGRVRFEGAVDCAADVAACFHDACARLAAFGARIVDVTLDGYDFARMRRAGLIVCEAEGSAAMREALSTNPEGFSEELRRMLAYGAALGAERLAVTYAEIARARLVAREAFAQCDFLLMPTTPQTAFAHGDPVPVNQADFTAFASLCGLPALSVPMGLGANGLPTGLQIVGRALQDCAVLTVGEEFERLRNA